MKAIAPDEREKLKVVELINRDQSSDHIHANAICMLGETRYICIVFYNWLRLCRRNMKYSWKDASP